MIDSLVIPQGAYWNSPKGYSDTDEAVKILWYMPLPSGPVVKIRRPSGEVRWVPEAEVTDLPLYLDHGFLSDEY